MFAAAAIFLRGYLEEGLIGDTLERELNSHAEAYYKSRDENTPLLWEFSKIKGRIVGPAKFTAQPFDWQRLPNGVHRVTERRSTGAHE